MILLALTVTMAVWAQREKMQRVEKLAVRPADQGKNFLNEPVRLAAPFNLTDGIGSRDLNKISMSSSLNANGIFNYEQRYVVLDQATSLFSFGNRAGGVFGNTGNDLKYKFTTDNGSTWDSTVMVSNGVKKFRYPSMVLYNPGNGANKDEIYGIMTGPITETDWTDQFFGSIRFDGQYADMNYQANVTGTYLNHMNIGLYCSPDGHVTVGSQRLNGATGAYTYDGWEILNGTFNAAQHKFDWQLPFMKISPNLLEEGRIDANIITWSPDGSVGYLLGTAVDADPAYNPYGVEWPVIYKSTDHGLSWNKIPAFDFSTLPVWETWLYPTRANLEKIIPRWYNKWASPDNQSSNGGTVDQYGNLHIFAVVRSTMSVHADSLNYFYTDEPILLFDVHMKPGGGWDAFLVDSILTGNPPDTGPYGISWDHQTQMSRTPDGSKVFMAWTDSDPNFGTENMTPDIKGMGYDVVTGLATPVKNFTEGTLYWMENWWLRLADEVFYDEANHVSQLPVTTSVMGATSADPLVHQYVTGLEINDNEFSIITGKNEMKPSLTAGPVSGCYPNPFSGRSYIHLSLDKATSVSLKVSTLTGQSVCMEDQGIMTPGEHRLMINGERFTTGIYFYTVLLNGTPYSGKMVVR
jgi:hypothetical protein